MGDPIVQKNLLKHSVMDFETGCWNWVASCHSGGYGQIGGTRDNGKRWRDGAHRASYREFIGEIPDGLHILHKCHNPLCINTSHLKSGTHAENMRQKKERNPLGSAGENNPNCKLTNCQIVSIKNSKSSYKFLSEAFGVSQTQIYRIKKGLQR